MTVNDWAALGLLGCALAVIAIANDFWEDRYEAARIIRPREDR